MGAGESGKGAALLASARGYRVFVSDHKVIDAATKSLFVENGIGFEENGHTESTILSSTEVIKSPGIPEGVQVVQRLKDAGVPIIDELEFASRYTSAKLITVTGTNGKTTTTRLIEHLLTACGINALAVGNIGNSLAGSLALQGDRDVFVIEASSFQIDGFKEIRPDVSVILNITPDHLDRYGSMKAYAASKLRLADMTTGAVVYFADDQMIANSLDSQQLKALKMKVSLSEKKGMNGWVFENAINTIFGGQELQVSFEDMNIKGLHNMVNAMSAVLAVNFLGVDQNKIKEGITSFRGMPHRFEFVATINGVDYINDSKATNVDAVKYALDALDRPLVWIAGGIDKGNDYKGVMSLVNEKVKALICLGKDNVKLRDAFHEEILSILETTSMEDAVQKSSDLAQWNDVVLLSPACASFDLFQNYEDRGNQFKNAVMKLKEKRILVL